MHTLCMDGLGDEKAHVTLVAGDSLYYVFSKADAPVEADRAKTLLALIGESFDKDEIRVALPPGIAAFLAKRLDIGTVVSLPQRVGLSS